LFKLILELRQEVAQLRQEVSQMRSGKDGLTTQKQPAKSIFDSGKTLKPGARDGEIKKGPRDGEGPAKPGPRDGDSTLKKTRPEGKAVPKSDKDQR
jgi:hypothetical protein